MLRTVTIAAALAATFAVATPGQASEWPGGELRYLLHVNPGGATDVMARRLAEGLQQVLDVNVVVENRPGGSGARQMAQLSMAEKDGRTIGSVTASHLGMFVQSGEFNIDSAAWACGLVLDPYLLAVRADSPFQTLGDLAAAAKANPGSLSVAGFGEGSGGQIAWMMFEEAAGLTDRQINWVPYNSVGDGVVAALGGHNDVVIGYIGLVRQHVAAGTMRVLGIMSDSRAEALPDAPTYAEAGFDVNTDWQQFRGVIMPADTPMEYQDALCDAVEKVMATEEMKAYIAESELVPGFMRPAAFRAFVDSQNELTTRWMARF